MKNDSFNSLEAYSCPRCGAAIDFVFDNSEEFQCEYCGSRIRLRSNIPQNISITYCDNLDPEKALTRAGQLMYVGEDQQAKELIQKTLIQYPNNKRLLEFENVTRCFLTRNFGNYIKMLAACSFFAGGLEKRYVTEINGFCGMLSNRADSSINIATYRKQNLENYSLMLGYLSDLKKCLQNDAVIHTKALYDTVLYATLKFSATLCNTIYLRGNEYKMLINFSARRKLEQDFNEIVEIFDSNYKVVSESEIKKYVRSFDE